MGALEGLSARRERRRGGRLEAAVAVLVLGIALQLTETRTIRAAAECGVGGAFGGDEAPQTADYTAVAALGGATPAIVGMALARARGDAQELVIGVCGAQPGRPVRLVVDGVEAATLLAAETGVVNATLSSAPGAVQPLPRHARPVSRLRRVELIGGDGRAVVSGELVRVTVRPGPEPPPARAAAAPARTATATP